MSVGDLAPFSKFLEAPLIDNQVFEFSNTLKVGANMMP